MCVLSKPAYLAALRVSAASAAEPAFVAESPMYDSAKGQTTVTSHYYYYYFIIIITVHCRLRSRQPFREGLVYIVSAPVVIKDTTQPIRCSKGVSLRAKTQDVTRCGGIDVPVSVRPVMCKYDVIHTTGRACNRTQLCYACNVA